ncbi:MAG: YgcG family protein [Spirochaetota bacterium]
MKWVFTVLCALCVSVTAITQELAPIPPLRAHVNDYADILSSTTEAELEAKLTQLEKEDSTQVVVATVPSIGNEDIESYSIRLADTWKIGQKGLDNGVIVLVARDNRKVRIEVGKGLEETLTDLLAGRIIDYIIIPEFKNGDYDAGITKAVDAIIDIVKGKFDANSLKPQKSAPDYAAFMWIAFIVMSFISAFRRLLSGILGAIVLPIIGAFFGYTLSALILLAIIGFIAGIILSSMKSGGGGFSSGGFSSGGGFSSSGGFSGGGGSFGGGGSSGSW